MTQHAAGRTCLPAFTERLVVHCTVPVHTQTAQVLTLVCLVQVQSVHSRPSVAGVVPAAAEAGADGEIRILPSRLSSSSSSLSCQRRWCRTSPTLLLACASATLQGELRGRHLHACKPGGREQRLLHSRRSNISSPVCQQHTSTTFQL